MSYTHSPLHWLRLFIVILIASFSAFSATDVSAQGDYEDVVYLKNGSIIRGMIIEQVPGLSIKIQTADRNVFVFKMDEVEKMTKELSQARPSSSSSSGSTKLFKQSGYLNITEMNIGAGTGDYSKEQSIGIQVVNGYLINPHFSIGLGVGVDRYKAVTFLPVFLDMRAYFINAPVTPFFATGIGYALSFSDGNQGGIIANPSVGVRFAVNTKAALALSLGYRHQENTVTYTYPYSYGYSTTFKQSVGLINIKIGAFF